MPHPLQAKTQAFFLLFPCLLKIGKPCCLVHQLTLHPTSRLLLTLSTTRQMHRYEFLAVTQNCSLLLCSPQACVHEFMQAKLWYNTCSSVCLLCQLLLLHFCCINGYSNLIRSAQLVNVYVH